MTLTSRALTLLCLSSLSAGCLAPQVLGDPQETGTETDGGGGGETEGNASTTSVTEGMSGPAETDAGSESTEGKPDECIPQGSACPSEDGFAECCGATVCSAETGRCEPTGTGSGGEVCGDYAPPPVDCPAQGDIDISFEPGESFFLADSRPCQVTAVSGENVAGWTVALGCDDEFAEFTYASGMPNSEPVFEVGASVLYSAADRKDIPFPNTSVALHDSDGRLLLAYIDAFGAGAELPLDLAPLEISLAGTGCFGFNAGAALCDVEGESIAAARISVEVGPGDPVSIADGNSASIVLDMPYFVTVGEATRIVCWDDSCVGDEGGPHDRLRLLVVAQPVLDPE